MIYVNKKWMSENIDKIELIDGTTIKNTSHGLDLIGKRFKLLLTKKGMKNVEHKQCVDAGQGNRWFYVKIKGERYSATAYY